MKIQVTHPIVKDEVKPPLWLKILYPLVFIAIWMKGAK
jgi:hypothetical protein